MWSIAVREKVFAQRDSNDGGLGKRTNSQRGFDGDEIAKPNDSSGDGHRLFWLRKFCARWNKTVVEVEKKKNGRSDALELFKYNRSARPGRHVWAAANTGHERYHLIVP